MELILPHGAATWGDVVAAGATVLGALIVAWLAAGLMRSGERRLLARSPRPLDAAAQTRLRLVRRLVLVAIVVTGVLLALLQFEAFDRLARAALASGALLSAIIGFAARESLANVIAGISIAVTQPLRVGDWVGVGETQGTIEDITLAHTWVRTPDGGRVIVPNAVIATTPVRNDSIRAHEVAPSATVWMRADADETAALRALAGIEGATGAAVDGATPEGIRLRVFGPTVTAASRGTAEERLCAHALAALREAGIPRASPG